MNTIPSSGGNRFQGTDQSVTFTDSSAMDTSTSSSYSSYASVPLLPGAASDSGFYDSAIPAGNPGKLPVQSSNTLAEWQDIILSVWYANNRRFASDTDVILFRNLLKAPEQQIKRRLRQLFVDDDERSSDMGRQSFTTPSSQEYDSHTSTGFPAATGSIQNHPAEVQPEPFLNDNSTALAVQMPSVDGLPNSASMNQSRTAGDSMSYSQTNAPATEAQAAPEQMHANAQYTNQQPLHQNSVFAVNPVGRQPNQRVKMTASIRNVILKFIETRIAKRCLPIRSHEKQDGIYECTLKCSRHFRTACDLFRHESTVFPQDFWFCHLCGDSNNASEKYLFTREDKVRYHLKNVHANMGSVADLKVPDAPKVFPERCKICLHHRYRSWKDRCKHIIWHYKRGDALGKYFDNRDKQGSAPPGGDGDDGDDDDDQEGPRGHDDDQGHSTEEDDGPHTPDDDLPPANPDPTNDANSGSPNNGMDDFSDFVNWSSPFWGLKTTVSLSSVPKLITPKSHVSASRSLPIQWEDRVNQKGGTASVFKVEVPADDDDPAHAKPQLRVVKRYSAQNRHLFDRELRAFSILQQKREHPHIITCLGSFIQHDQAGVPSYNLLLPNAQSDLFEYFADTAPPAAPAEIAKFWSQVNGIADALKYLHWSGRSGTEACRGWHADLKPDNILVTKEEGNVTWKLSDFGMSKFVPRRHAKAVMDGGTATYSAPELSQCSNGHASLPVSQKVDVWSMGCILSECATWVVTGFQGIQTFEERRRRDMRGMDWAIVNTKAPFHDGKQVLPEVKSWHEYLRGRIQRDDHVTAKILDLIDGHLLQPDPDLRHDSKQLHADYDRILQEAEDKRRIADTRAATQATNEKLADTVAAVPGALQNVSMPGRGASEILELYPDGQRPRDDTNSERDGAPSSMAPKAPTLPHEPPEPLKDVIFVHGLRGGSASTWRKMDNDRHFWPKALLPKESDLQHVPHEKRKVTCWGYSLGDRQNREPEWERKVDIPREEVLDRLSRSQIDARQTSTAGMRTTGKDTAETQIPAGECRWLSNDSKHLDWVDAAVPVEWRRTWGSGGCGNSTLINPHFTPPGRLVYPPMDPPAALGLATSIVQLVECAVRLVDTTKKILSYCSSQMLHLKTDLETLQQNTRRMTGIMKTLQASPGPSRRMFETLQMMEGLLRKLHHLIPVTTIKQPIFIRKRIPRIEEVSYELRDLAENLASDHAKSRCAVMSAHNSDTASTLPSYGSPETYFGSSLQANVVSSQHQEPSTVDHSRLGRMSKAQKGISQHSCGERGRSHTREEHLRRHQKSHATESSPVLTSDRKPFSCAFCSTTTFSTKNDWKRHEYPVSTGVEGSLYGSLSKNRPPQLNVTVDGSRCGRDSGGIHVDPGTSGKTYCAQEGHSTKACSPLDTETINTDKLAQEMTERFRQILSTKRMNELVTRSRKSQSLPETPRDFDTPQPPSYSSLRNLPLVPQAPQDAQSLRFRNMLRSLSNPLTRWENPVVLDESLWVASTCNNEEYVTSEKRLAQVLDQHLAGRQENSTYILAFTDSGWGIGSSSTLENLIGEYWRSRRRRTNMDNLHLCFVAGGVDEDENARLKRLAQQFPFIRLLPEGLSPQVSFPASGYADKRKAVATYTMSLSATHRSASETDIGHDHALVGVGDWIPYTYRPVTSCRRGTKRAISDETRRSVALLRRPGACKRCSGFTQHGDLSSRETCRSRPWKCTEEYCKYYELGWQTVNELSRHIRDNHSASPKPFRYRYEPCGYSSKRDLNFEEHAEKAYGRSYTRSRSNGRTEALVSTESTASMSDKPFDHNLPLPLLTTFPGTPQTEYYEPPRERLGCRPASALCTYSKPTTPDELWETLSQHRSPSSSNAPQERFNTASFYQPSAGMFGNFLQQEGAKFDESFFNISPREALSMDPQQRLLLECAYEALEEAGALTQHTVGKDIGTFIGAETSSFYDFPGRPSIPTSSFYGLPEPSMVRPSIRTRESRLSFVGADQLMIGPDSLVRSPEHKFDKNQEKIARSRRRPLAVSRQPGPKLSTDAENLFIYVRPRHPKIMCPYCNERPQGFRGTHELERHMARAHVNRKWFVCVDASEDRNAISDSEAVMKHYRHRQTYGAYYNAAAHLRRAHFHPRKSGRSKHYRSSYDTGSGNRPTSIFELEDVSLIGSRKRRLGMSTCGTCTGLDCEQCQPFDNKRRRVESPEAELNDGNNAVVKRKQPASSPEDVGLRKDNRCRYQDNGFWVHLENEPKRCWNDCSNENEKANGQLMF